MERHLCSWIGRLNIVKLKCLQICRFNIILIKVSTIFFGWYRPENSKIYMERKYSTIIKITLGGKKNVMEEIHLPNFKTYIATVIKNMWYLQEDTYTDWWNRLMSPEIAMDNLVDFWQRCKSNSTDKVFSKNVSGTLWYL